MILSIYWDPSPAVFNWPLPLFGRPLLWYGCLFALGFYLAYRIFLHQLRRTFHWEVSETRRFVDRAGLYVGAGMLIGARLFDVLFYQTPSSYVHHPLEILKFWNGGLASHGALVGILVALWLLSKKKDSFRFLQWIDLLVVPCLAAGACIRIGNFFNQEIVGIPSSLPWAVFFAHPADGSVALPRHPVQLYESLFYGCLAIYLWNKQELLKRCGLVAGLFFIGCFGFRFFVEFLKEEQSALLSVYFPFRMGQLLSIPVICAGVWLLYRTRSLRYKQKG